MTTPLERRLFSYAHAAAYLGIGVRKMKEIGGPNGVLRQVKIGGAVRFDKADLDKYVDDLKAAS